VLGGGGGGRSEGLLKIMWASRNEQGADSHSMHRPHHCCPQGYIQSLRVRQACWLSEQSSAECMHGAPAGRQTARRSESGRTRRTSARLVPAPLVTGHDRGRPPPSCRGDRAPLADSTSCRCPLPLLLACMAQLEKGQLRGDQTVQCLLAFTGCLPYLADCFKLGFCSGNTRVCLTREQRHARREHR